MKRLLNCYFSQTIIKLLSDPKELKYAILILRWFKSIPETKIFFILLSSKNSLIIFSVKQCLCFRLFQGRQYVCEKSGKYKNNIPCCLSLDIHNSNVST